MIYLASDHAGFALKKIVEGYLAERGEMFVDLGCDDETSCDYSDYAHKLANQIIAEPGSRGIGICGSGIGISIALNRHAGIRAARCRDVLDAEMCRRHNDANILVLAGRQTDEPTARAMVEKFLKTAFEGGRHETRVKKIEIAK